MEEEKTKERKERQGILNALSMRARQLQKQRQQEREEQRRQMELLQKREILTEKKRHQATSEQRHQALVDYATHVLEVINAETCARPSSKSLAMGAMSIHFVATCAASMMMHYRTENDISSDDGQNVVMAALFLAMILTGFEEQCYILVTNTFKTRELARFCKACDLKRVNQIMFDMIRSGNTCPEFLHT